MAQNETDQQRRTDDVEGQGQGGEDGGDVEREGSGDPGTDQPEGDDAEADTRSEAERLDQANISGGGGRGQGAEYGDSGYEQPSWSPSGGAGTDLGKDAADPNVGPLDG
jgi:hypothetical protein